MFKRIIGFSLRMAALAVACYQLAYKPWRRRWHASPEESTKPLPGDELVADPQFVQTLALTIDAPPSRIWPWLVQMGYGRAGWYSYDAIDMLGHSSREIRPELQDVSVGQVLPLAPGMGFRVEVVEPERALVLFGDSKVIEEQQRAARMSADEPGDEAPGLKFVGALSNANSSEFQVSWAFVLEPIGAGRTRLLERFRTRTVAGPAAAVVSPIVDVGHFLMTRKQMLGIRERAETPVTEATPSQADEIEDGIAVPA